MELNKYLVETNNPERDGAAQVYCAENPEEAVELYYFGEFLRFDPERIFKATDKEAELVFYGEVVMCNLHRKILGVAEVPAEKFSAQNLKNLSPTAIEEKEDEQQR